MSSPTQPPTPKADRKEISSEVRMLLAFVLMGLILLATPYVYKLLGIQPPPPTDKKAAIVAKTPDQQKAPATATAGGAPMSVPNADSATPAPPVLTAANEEDKVVDTDLYHVVFSNRGAVVKSWTLKNFKDRRW